MALTKNVYLTDHSLNYLKGTSIPTLTSISAVLTTALPLRTDTNSTIIRPTYSSYTDIVIPSSSFSSITENSTGGSSMTTTADVVFPSPSTTPPSAITILGLVIIDNSNNILYQGQVSTPLVISTSGQIIKIPLGSLTIIEA